MLFQHFDWDLTHQVLLLHILPSNHMNLERPAFKTGRCSYVGAELTFVAEDFLEKSP